MKLDLKRAFRWREETGKSGEKPSEHGENQQQTQPTYDIRPESNASHISGMRNALTTASSLPSCLYTFYKTLNVRVNTAVVLWTPHHKLVILFYSPVK